MTARRLSRAALAAEGMPAPAPPVRIVHLGAGAFHRAHQAWYTARADDAWGIAAFTGRSRRVADLLRPQDGLYTLVERGGDHDRFEIVGSIAEVNTVADHPRLLDLFGAEQTAVVTLTVTEAGYHLRPDGSLNLDDPAIAADIRALRHGQPPATPVGRITAGLAHRHRHGLGALAVVSCDNLPRNGARLRAAMLALADAASLPRLDDAASFVSTSVDRITPHEVDSAAVADATGWVDAAPVITEPFSDWTLSGEFPAGRPAWESAGARFVDDIEPFEQRKLLLLNGGHLHLAFHGLVRGLETIAEAAADPACRLGLNRFWDEAARTVGSRVDPDAYRAALLARFDNPRIAHRLDQIAVDTVTKLRLRVLPVLRAERAAGRDAAGALSIIGAWRDAIDQGVLPDRAAAASPADALAALVSGMRDADAATIYEAATKVSL